MKYFIILIFLISFQSFSENVDGKLISCNLKTIYKYNNLIKCSTYNKIDTVGSKSCKPTRNKILIGFNLNKAYIPEIDKDNLLKPKVKLVKKEYGINHNEVFFGAYILQRKTLILDEYALIPDKEKNPENLPTLGDLGPNAKLLIEMDEPIAKRFSYLCEVEEFSKKKLKSSLDMEIQNILDKEKDKRKGNKI